MVDFVSLLSDHRLLRKKVFYSHDNGLYHYDSKIVLSVFTIYIRFNCFRTFSILYCQFKVKSYSFSCLYHRFYTFYSLLSYVSNTILYSQLHIWLQLSVMYFTITLFPISLYNTSNLCAIEFQNLYFSREQE